MKIINKFKNAFIGIGLAVQDASIRVQCICFLLINIACLILQVNIQDLVIIWLVSGLVIVSEMFNTCIERLADVVQPSYDERIRYIKDLSAGAVLVSCLFAALIGCTLLIKYVGGLLCMMMF